MKGLQYVSVKKCKSSYHAFFHFPIIFWPFKCESELKTCLTSRFDKTSSEPVHINNNKSVYNIKKNQVHVFITYIYSFYTSIHFCHQCYALREYAYFSGNTVSYSLFYRSTKAELIIVTKPFKRKIFLLLWSDVHFSNA